MVLTNICSVTKEKQKFLLTKQMCGYFETLNETLTEHGFLLDFQLPPADATKEDRRPICGLAVGREYTK